MISSPVQNRFCLISHENVSRQWGERVQIATPLHCLAVQIPVSSVRPSLFFRELVLADTTERTYEILWEILKRCAWLYACLWHSYLWVILPAAYVAYILFHNCCCFNGLLIVMNIPFACHARRCQGRVMSGGIFLSAVWCAPAPLPTGVWGLSRAGRHSNVHGRAESWQ